MSGADVHDVGDNRHEGQVPGHKALHEPGAGSVGYGGCDVLGARTAVKHPQAHARHGAAVR